MDPSIPAGRPRDGDGASAALGKHHRQATQKGGVVAASTFTKEGGADMIGYQVDPDRCGNRPPPDLSRGGLRWNGLKLGRPWILSAGAGLDDQLIKVISL